MNLNKIINVLKKEFLLIFFLVFFIILFILNSIVNHTNEKTPADDINFTENISRKEKINIYKYYSANDINLNDVRNIYLYTEIYKLIGTAHSDNAKNTIGLDCSGFVKIIFEKVYNVKLSGGSADIFKFISEVKKKNVKEGDLVFFNINSKIISHIGIYLMNDKFAHTSSKKGVTINNLNEDYYLKYYCCSGRLKTINQ